MGLKEEALKAFPASSFRKYQKEVIEKIAELFESGVRCILLDAPVGFGKSYVNTAFARIFESFYTTPQLTLIDQILRDPRLQGIFKDIRGRQNYRCKYDPNATVDVGMCERQVNFPCNKYEECPYWIRKRECLKWSPVLMSFAYFILEGRTEGFEYSFRPRELLIVDEGHSIDRHIVDHMSLIVSPVSLPGVYESVRRWIQDEYRDSNEVRGFVETVRDYVKEQLSYVQTTLDGGVALSREEAMMKKKLEDWLTLANLFLEDESNEWVWSVRWMTLPDGSKRKYLVIQPVYARAFGYELVWRRAERYIISSATIIDAEMFIKETGLDRAVLPSEVAHLKVPMTFPARNRPIIDATVGKLTIDERSRNIGKAVRMIEEILRREPGNVAIHCHSYEFMRMLARFIHPCYVDRIITHEPEDREKALEEWKRSRGKVFACVAFTEGQDWKGEICDAQILLKTPYPDSENDARVKRRLEKKEWVWYRLEALKQVMQAYGRAIRSEDDKARFYVIDSSFEDLISWCWKWIPSWFKEALPPHWNKDVVKAKVAELRKLGYRGTEAELKRIAKAMLKAEAKELGLAL